MTKVYDVEGAIDRENKDSVRGSKGQVCNLTFHRIYSAEVCTNIVTPEEPLRYFGFAGHGPLRF